MVGGGTHEPQVAPAAHRPARNPASDRAAVAPPTRKRSEPGDYVFCQRNGKPVSPTGVRKRFLRTRAAAGLRPLRFHDLRHAFGSIAVREVDTATLKAWMGHAKLVTTERYLHAKPRHDDAARLDRAFNADARPSL